MAGLSAYLEEALLNHVLRGDSVSTSYTPPSAVYVALHTADPTDAGLTTDEVPTGIYARAAASFGAPVGSTVSNVSAINFRMPVVTVSWVSIWDSQTGGNMLLSNALPSPQTFSSGDSIAFLPGSLQISLA